MTFGENGAKSFFFHFVLISGNEEAKKRNNVKKSKNIEYDLRQGKPIKLMYQIKTIQK